MIPKRLMVLLSACIVAMLFWPSEAAAQRHGYHTHGSTFVTVGGFYRPYFYDPFFFGAGLGWYPGWYPIYPAYPYPAGYWYGPSWSSARLQITPKTAEAYIDGYYVGQVDDFDGVFQRLDVPPGQHELQVYMDGYKTFRQKILFRPGDTVKIKAALEPLPAGEAREARPVAAPPPQGQYPPPPGEPQGHYAVPGPGRTRPMPPQGPEPGGAQTSSFGTLAIRVQPSDATVVIDGERWDSPEGGSRLLVQLSPGSHQIEVRKEGFKTYTTTVTIRAGATESINVSLSNGGGALSGQPTMALGY